MPPPPGRKTRDNGLQPDLKSERSPVDAKTRMRSLSDSNIDSPGFQAPHLVDRTTNNHARTGSFNEGQGIGPEAGTVLLIKPVWGIAYDGFADAWNRLLSGKQGLWSGKVLKEGILADKSIFLILKSHQTALAIARDVTTFVRKQQQDTGPAALPIQMIVDSGHYPADNSIAAQGLAPYWNEMAPGYVYVSATAYALIKDKGLFSIVRNPETNRSNPMYVVIDQGQAESKSDPYIFSYQRALSRGENPPCYYCGCRKHVLADCPSKQLPWTTRGLERLGYLSFERIERLFFEYVVHTKSRDQAHQTDVPRSIQLAHYGLYELKRPFQLRCFLNIWNADDDNWTKLKETPTEVDKGGLLWIALDCLRVSNLTQAEAYLNSCTEKYPNDYRPYCALGLLNVEKNNFIRAEQCFERALDYISTKPQKALILFLLCRLYEVYDRPFKAAEKIREILRVVRHCEEAVYLDVVRRFREEKSAEAIQLLIDLIQENREFFTAALIDPDLEPFSKVIHPELKRLFVQAKEQAAKVAQKAEEDLKELEGLMDEKDIKETRSFLSKVEDLSMTDGYFAYTDIIYQGESILALSRKSIQERRGNLLNTLQGLSIRIRTCLNIAVNYPYPRMAAALQKEIVLLSAEINQAYHLARSNIPEEFKAALKLPERLSPLLHDVELQTARLQAVGFVLSSLADFLKNSLIFLSAALFFAIILFPIMIYYINLFLPKYGMPQVHNIWYYQKTILVSGSVSAFVLSIARTIRSMHKHRR